MQSLLPQSSRCASPQGRSRFRTPPSARGTGGVSPRHRGGPRSGPPGVRRPDALNPPEESPSEPWCLLRSMPEPWRLSGREATKLSPAIKRALASGWTAQSLKAHLSRSPEGVRYPAAVLARRLAELPTPPSTSDRRGLPWCGECEDDQSRTITITLPDGTEAAAFCPRCSPQMRPRSAVRNVFDFNSIGGETIGEQRL
jgi:hypothetical protein